MLKIAKTEFYKLKRYSVVWIGVATMLTVVLLQFFVSDAGKAAQIIDGAFKIKSMKIVDKNTLYLYDMSFPVAMINRTLVEAGIDVSEAHLCENTLEDYFKKITGGEGIA